MYFPTGTYRSLHELDICQFHFTFGPVDPFCTELVLLKLQYMKQEAGEQKGVPIGELVFLIHMLDLPFTVSFHQNPDLPAELEEQVREEYEKFFASMVRGRIITEDGRSIPAQTPPQTGPSI